MSHKLKLIILFIVFFLVLFLINFKKIKNHISLREDVSCIKINDSKKKTSNEKNIRILIAGHSYGSPSGKNFSTYPTFLKALNKKYKEKLSLIILGGDIVRKSNKKNLTNVKDELAKFTENLMIAPGNHDVKKSYSNERKIFYEIFKKNSKKYILNSNLFYVLDSSFDPYQIDNNNFNSISYILDKHKFKNIFIISHHIIWHNQVKKNIVNNNKNRELVENNFKEFFKLIENKSPKSTKYFVAGDVGANKSSKGFYCEKKDKTFFIATGMGNKLNDNFISIVFSETGNILELKPIFF